MSEPNPPPKPGASASLASRVLGRRQLLGGVLALGAVAVTGCAQRRSPGEPETPVRIGRTGKGNYDLIMQAAGLAPSGFQVLYSDFQSGHLQVEALNGGSLDVGSMSEIPPVFAAASSMQSFRQIATLNADVNNQVILVP